MNGGRLREIRKSLRLQQTDVAEFLGVDNETVCRWEKLNRELNKLQEDAIELLSADPKSCRIAWCPAPPARGKTHGKLRCHPTFCFTLLVHFAAFY
jgi:transcriptional regulator with XRE-family HTH domain